MRLRGLLSTVLLAGLLLGTGLADTIQKGDVFAAVGSGQVQWWRGNTIIQTLNTGQGGYTTGMAFDSSGRLYVTNFSANTVSVFNTDGSSAGLFGSGYSTPESIVFNAAGDAFVGNLGNGLREYDGAGNLVQSYATGRVDWFDLSADGKTAYYTTEGGQIKTFNLATNTAGAPFTTAGGDFALRLLPTGGVIVADNSQIDRFDASGNLVQSYDLAGVDGWFALNLDPNGTAFWSGSFQNGDFYEFDLASGNLLATRSTGSGSLFGLAVAGELTVVNPPSQVPEPSSLLLLGSGGVGLLGVMRRKWLS